jgi:hypothetical protein
MGFNVKVREFTMYYEEKIIDGILYWRGSPNEQFREFSKRELCQKIIKLKTVISELEAELENCDYN